MFGTKNWTCTYVWNSDLLSIVLNYEESFHMWEKVILVSFTLSYELCSHYNSILQISTYVKLNMYTYVVYTYPHIPFKWISNTLIKRIWQFLGTIILKLWIDSKSRLHRWSLSVGVRNVRWVAEAYQERSQRAPLPGNVPAMPRWCWRAERADALKEDICWAVIFFSCVRVWALSLHALAPGIWWWAGRICQMPGGVLQPPANLSLREAEAAVWERLSSQNYWSPGEWKGPESPWGVLGCWC